MHCYHLTDIRTGHLVRHKCRSAYDGVVMGSSETILEYLNGFDIKALSVLEIFGIKMEDGKHLRCIIQNTTATMNSSAVPSSATLILYAPKSRGSSESATKIPCEKARLGPEPTPFLLPAMPGSKKGGGRGGNGMAENEERLG